jgi:hypothetical protein
VAHLRANNDNNQQYPATVERADSEFLPRISMPATKTKQIIEQGAIIYL